MTRLRTKSPLRLPLRLPVAAPALRRGVTDSDAKAYLDGYASSASAEWKDALNTLVTGWKTKDLWERADWLLAPCADSPPGARRNIRNLAKQATEVNFPIHTAYRGYQGDGSSSCLDLGEPFVAPGNQFSQNSGTLGVYINLQVSTANVAVLGNVGSTRKNIIQARAVPGNTAMQLNSPTAAVLETGPTSKLGHKTVVRSDANTLKGYVNGSLVATQANNATSPSADNGCLLRSTMSYSPDQLGFFYSAAAFTDADVANAHALIMTFLTTVGAN